MKLKYKAEMELDDPRVSVSEILKYRIIGEESREFYIQKRVMNGKNVTWLPVLKDGSTNFFPSSSIINAVADIATFKDIEEADEFLYYLCAGKEDLDKIIYYPVGVDEGEEI